MLMSSAASTLARLSTLGHAQMSLPTASYRKSYRTMPSRMLVVLTAATSAPSAPAARSAARTQAAIACQLACTSKS
jgi:hypothetical protein